MTIQNRRACVIVENPRTDPFDILTGMRQGDPLSATLLNLVLESVIRKLYLRGDISFKLMQLNAYADDIVLIARTKTIQKGSMETNTRREKYQKRYRISR
jgi:hypothetical protein